MWYRASDWYALIAPLSPYGGNVTFRWSFEQGFRKSDRSYGNEGKDVSYEIPSLP